MIEQTIYLDYAAATPVDAEVLAAMQPYFSENFYNPSATYSSGREVKAAVDNAKASIAHWLGSRPSEIIVTAGGTEANNLAIQGIMRRYPEANLVVSAVEHESILEPAKLYDHKELTVTAEGRIDVAALKATIDEQTVLVSIMYANNEVGTIQPIREASRVVDGIRRQRQEEGNHLPIYLHTDACQAANYLDMHVARLGVDMLTLNGGKMYGPKQSGVLYVRGGVELAPLILGGGQERGLRSGTENVAALVGLATALDRAQTDRHDQAERVKTLQQRFMAAIEETFPEAIINGSRKQRLPNNIHVTFPGVDNERLLIQLDEAGILAAAGSACSASDEEPSHVLRALGLSDLLAQASIRFTLGKSSSEHDIEQTIVSLRRFVTPNR